MSVKYPSGIETFEKIIKGGYAYVDKTELIYKLTQTAQCVFLSRPRRFGKSLTLTTLESYFEGRRELFEGLWLGSAEGVGWTAHPVLRLNFVRAACTVDGVNNLIMTFLQDYEKDYGVEDTSGSFSDRFARIIKQANQVTGQQVVILIDEYDKVLAGTVSHSRLHAEIKGILKPLFSILKDSDRYIRFAMLTGVSRFSKLSIFSDLNNLTDISLDERFGAVCGVTEAEMRRYFKEGIEAFATQEKVTFEQMVQILKDNYDGYHFSENCPDIFNPYSLINALDTRKITHRWFESGTPTFLVEMMRDTDEDVRSILSTHAEQAALASTDTESSNLIPLLFQTGYLTIKGYNRQDEEYTLGIPNREVAKGLFRCLLPVYSGRSGDASMRIYRNIRNALRQGKAEEMMEHLHTFFADIPYDLSKGRAEAYFQNNLYIMFKLLGFAVDAEYRTARGRIDILVKTDSYIYIMELKLDGTAEQALQQIDDNGYAEPFADDYRRVFRIGISFSKTERNIDQWVIV